MTPVELRHWLVSRIAVCLGIDQALVAIDAPFQALGLESVDLLEISGDLEEQLGRPIDPTILYEFPTILDLAPHLATDLKAAEPAPATPVENDAIAIVGIACRVPGAGQPNELWKHLLEGADFITEIPADRWQIDALYDPEPLAPGKMSTRWGGFLEDVDSFDHDFFGISSAEAAAMDPQQRMLLELSWEAFEDANLPPEQMRGKNVGVFVGISHNDYESAHFQNLDAITGFSGAGNALSISPNRISYQFDFRGPSLAIDTACSSALYAIHLAVRSLREGECECALAGGVNVILSPDLTVTFSKAGMMSPDGRCKTFDASANGYVRSEGAALVLVRPLTEAIRRKDRIYAVIRGSAVSQDGRSNGLNAPNPAAQEAVLRAAYKDAGVDPRTVDYVEAHGTGTRLGDPIEARALGRVIGEDRRQGPCLIGSIKSNIGHLEAAAGAAGLIKGALVAKHRLAPPTIHYHTANPLIDFEGLGLEVARSATGLGSLARVGVSAFGFGGANAHVVLESPPPAPSSKAGARDAAHLIPLSARSPRSLEALRRRWIASVEAADFGTWALQDIASAAALGRQHLEHRIAYVARDRDELLRRLKDHLPIMESQVGERPICFMFPGQGSQHRGMVLDLMDRFAVIRQSLRESDSLLKRLAGFSILDEIATGARLSETAIAQPAIVAVQLAISDFLAAAGIRAGAVLGHSVGEIAAACVSGAMDRPAALDLAVRRGAIMSELGGQDGAMMAVFCAAPACQELIDETLLELDIAAENGPETTVVSGDRADVMRFAEACRHRGVETRSLAIEYAFHSRRMTNAAERLRTGLADFTGRPSVPYYSAVSGSRWDEPLDADYWARNVRDRVRFFPAYRTAAEDSGGAFIELGPDSALLPGIRQVKGPQEVHIALAHRRLRSDEALLGGLQRLYEAGAALDWSAIHPDGSRQADIPRIAWQHDDELRGVRLKSQTVSHLRPPLERGPWFGEQQDLPADYPLRLWRTDLVGERFPWLDDHRILGVPILPAAAMLSWMTGAVIAANQGDGVCLRDMRIISPLVLSPATVMATRVDLEHRRVLLHARSQPDGAWQPIAQAAYELGATSRLLAAAGDGLDQSAARCTELLDRNALYSQFAAAGLEYREAFRGVAEVRRGAEGEALAKLHSTALQRDIPAGLEPWLLDGAFQAVGATQDIAQIDKLRLVPVAADKVALSPGRTAAAAWIKSVNIDPRTARIKADVVLLDGVGKPSGAVLGLSFAPMSANLVSGLNDTRLATKLHIYADEWRIRRKAEVRDERRRLLVLLDRGRRAEPLAMALEQAGHHVVCLHRADVDAILDAATEVNSNNSGLQRLFSSMADIDTVVCCWGLDTSGVNPAMTSELLAFSRLVRSIALFGSAKAPRLWVITSGAFAAGDAGAASNPWQAGQWGLGLAAAFELPDLKCSRLDLDPGRPLEEASSDFIDLIADNPGDADQFAFRGGDVLVRELTKSAVGGRGEELRADGVYVITGGWGALGLIVAEALVACGARRLLLIGRSKPHDEARAIIEKLQASGAQIDLAHADVSDQDELKLALIRARAEAPIFGIVHAAGAIDDGALIDMTQAQLDQVLAGKVHGAWALHELTTHDPLDFFVVFSSAAASLGSFGQGAYIAANTVLSALMEHRRAKGLPGLAIEWGPWAERGMAADLVTPVPGVSMIDPKDGAEAFLRLLREPHSRILVLPFAVEAIFHLFPSNLGASIFRGLVGEEAWHTRLAAQARSIAARPDLSTPYCPPTSELESLITGIWQRALKIEPVGVRDLFFELGGDSVFAGQVIGEINRTLGIVLESEAAFTDLTVENLARLADRALIEAVEALSDEDVDAVLAAGGPMSGPGGGGLQ